jgi:hypothetical protein
MTTGGRGARLLALYVSCILMIKGRRNATPPSVEKSKSQFKLDNRAVHWAFLFLPQNSNCACYFESTFNNNRKLPQTRSTWIKISDTISSFSPVSKLQPRRNLVWKQERRGSSHEGDNGKVLRRPGVKQQKEWRCSHNIESEPSTHSRASVRPKICFCLDGTGKRVVQRRTR